MTFIGATRYVRERAVKRLIKYPHCCTSCHEDEEDYGYGLNELTPRDLGKNRMALVCCEVTNAFQKWHEEAGK